jgi:hypothetical protein
VAGRWSWGVLLLFMSVVYVEAYSMPDWLSRVRLSWVSSTKSLHLGYWAVVGCVAWASFALGAVEHAWASYAALLATLILAFGVQVLSPCSKFQVGHRYNSLCGGRGALRKRSWADGGLLCAA